MRECSSAGAPKNIFLKGGGRVGQRTKEGKPPAYDALARILDESFGLGVGFANHNSK